MIGTQTEADITVTGISADPEAVRSGDLFFALPGPAQTQAAQTAVRNGAAALICEEGGQDCLGGQGRLPLLRVANAKAALYDLAGYYRRQFTIPVVGVMGSSGKSCTQSMTAQVLGSRYRVLTNWRSDKRACQFPLSLFELDSGTEAAVLELSPDSPEVFACQAKAARPTVSVVTNIGLPYAKEFGSKEKLLEATLRVVSAMPREALAVCNGDDRLLYNSAPRKIPVYYFGVENKLCRFKSRDIGLVQGQTRLTVDYGVGETQIQLPCKGRYGVYNALAAFTVGFLLGIDPEEAAQALRGQGSCLRIQAAGL